MLLLVSCGRNEPSDESVVAQPDTPWERVSAEATPLVKPKESVARKLEKHQGALAAATYPVLVPADEAMLDRLTLVVKSRLYTSIALFKTHRVEVLGVRSGKPDAPDSIVLKDKRAEIEFVRWGVTYRVRVVCESVPEPDLSLCADSNLVTAIREKLVWINPR